MHPKYLLIAIVSSLLYFCLTILLLNATLVTETLTSSNMIGYKVSLLFYIITGVGSTLSSTDMLLFILTTILVGINIALSVALMKKVKATGKLTLTTTGGTLIGIVSAGCASCGFSVLSLFGLSGLVVFLPFGGEELYILAIILLSWSLYYNIQTLYKPLVCKSN